VSIFSKASRAWSSRPARASASTHQKESPGQKKHYVHWFNHPRLLEVNGDLPPIELEQTYPV
jgi:hypothetical protein